jgi:hypothetical protein
LKSSLLNEINDNEPIMSNMERDAIIIILTDLFFFIINNIIKESRAKLISQNLLYKLIFASKNMPIIQVYPVNI